MMNAKIYLLKYADYFTRLAKMLLILVPISLIALITRLFQKKSIWLVAERKSEARDNGMHFFNYIVENHPEINIYYAMNIDSPQTKNLKNNGCVIEFGSIKHYWIYAISNVAISTHVFGTSPVLMAARYIKLICPRKIVVSLQHGVSKDHYSICTKRKTGLDLLICGALPEFEYLKLNCDYKDNEIVYTGLCRFDYLGDAHSGITYKKSRKILFMPTFRKWLFDYSRLPKALAFESFKKDEYYQKIQEILNSPGLSNLLIEENIELNLLLHPSAHYFVNCFSSTCSNISIIQDRNSDIQQYIISSAALITDFSSVFFDFAYLNKPVIYYQFDLNDYRENHYLEGYYSYENDGFGPICETSEGVLDKLHELVSSNFKLNDIYLEKSQQYFPLRDGKNTERVYNAIIKRIEMGAQ